MASWRVTLIKTIRTTNTCLSFFIQYCSIPLVLYLALTTPYTIQLANGEHQERQPSLKELIGPIDKNGKVYGLF